MLPFGLSKGLLVGHISLHILMALANFRGFVPLFPISVFRYLHIALSELG